MREVVMSLMLGVCSERESSESGGHKLGLSRQALGGHGTTFRLSICIVLSNRLSHDHGVHKEVTNIVIVIANLSVHWKYRTFAV